jgi:hypothetical protein
MMPKRGNKLKTQTKESTHMNIVSSVKVAKFATVTPALAAKWLKLNIDNRKQRGSYINDIAGAMRRGEWQATHQGIAFSKTGRLLDGQHRLEAIVKSDIEVEVLVVVGLDESTFSVIDGGAKRSIADATKLSKRTAEVCTLFAKHMLGQSRPTSAQVAAVSEAGFAEVHEKLLEYCGSCRAFYSSAPLRAAAVALVLSGHDEKRVFQIYADIVLEHFNEMSGMAQGMVRHVNAGRINSTNTQRTFAYALKVLNPDNQHLTRLRLFTEDDVASAVSYGRSVVKRRLAA